MSRGSQIEEEGERQREGETWRKRKWVKGDLLNESGQRALMQQTVTVTSPKNLLWYHHQPVQCMTSCFTPIAAITWHGTTLPLNWSANIIRVFRPIDNDDDDDDGIQ